MAAVYSSIVSLMQHLQLLLASYHRISSSGRYGSRPCPFTKEEIQILYDSVSLMDALLRDSSSQDSYNRELTNLFRDRIVEVVREAENCVDLNLYAFLEGENAGNFSGIIFRGFQSRVVKMDPAEWRRATRLEKFDTDVLKRAVEVAEDAPSREPRKLLEINEELSFINNELKRLNHDHGQVGASRDPEEDRTSASGESVNLVTNNGGNLVGLQKELVMMLDRLIGLPIQLSVLATIGMGGIGKTTLARRLYDDPLVMHHFYVRAWVTVSQQFKLREILLGLLTCVAKKSDELYEMSVEQLREQVFKSLKHKRYLIVLDDMWDNNAWDDLRRTFPDDKNGSRIMITSRLKDVAIHASPDTPPHCMRCLTQGESWELLSLKLFGNDSCPAPLVPIGKEIARKCQGLPLAIVVVGGILSKMKFTLEIWKKVAEHVGSLVMEDPQYCQNILALSYYNLPDRLKTCFLYMGIFPEDYEISAKKLIWLWISEGFIRPMKQKSLEKVGEHYLEELISRSLILVKRKGVNGRATTCYIHDLMREMCLRESLKENFLSIVNSSVLMLPRGEDEMPDLLQLPEQLPETDRCNPRRLSVQSNIQEFIRTRSSFPLTRSFFCFDTTRSTNLRHRAGVTFKLLKVLDVVHIHNSMAPLGLVHLKFLALTIRNSSLITEILDKLIFLQTFIAYYEWDGLLPWNIFHLQELRHFYLKRSPQSSFSDRHDRGLSSPFGRLQHGEKLQMNVIKRRRLLYDLLSTEIQPMFLSNLQSLSAIRPLECTREAFLQMSKLKKLGIYETEEDCMFRGWMKNLFHLQELETLKYTFYNPFVIAKMKPDRLPSLDFFPPKLMKLTLSGTSFPWDSMSKLAMLPKLEVLKLRNYAFSGAVWRTKGGFSHLKYLMIGSTNLEIWETDGTHFPSLQHLILRHCISLKAVPNGLGEALLLEKIELHCCAESVITSVRQIQEEQQSLGNDYLTVHITHR